MGGGVLFLQVAPLLLVAPSSTIAGPAQHRRGSNELPRILQVPLLGTKQDNISEAYAVSSHTILRSVHLEGEKEILSKLTT